MSILTRLLYIAAFATNSNANSSEYIIWLFEFILLKKLKFIIKFIDYLINHWSFNSLSDSISGSNLSIESSSDLIFTQDQNELANNALYLKNNYLQTSVVSCYFYNEFTITIWFKTLFTKKLSLIDILSLSFRNRFINMRQQFIFYFWNRILIFCFF